MNKKYLEFIENKKHSIGDFGFKANYIPDMAFDFQKFIIEKSIKKKIGYPCKIKDISIQIFPFPFLRIAYLKLYLLKDDKAQVFIYQVFKQFLNVEDCAICFEETNVVTSCNHYCCHICMEKIKICPICRCDLYD